MPVDGSLGYMRVLVQRLEENHCVYISGERLATRQNIRAPLLGREALFAPGAPGLAWKVKSVLLPVHVVRDAPLRYRVIIDTPVTPDPALGKNEFVDDAIRRFAERVGRRVAEHPAGWSWYGRSVESWRAGAGEPAVAANAADPL